MSKIWWRVRSRSTSGASSWTTATFSRGQLAGPTPQAPAHGALLKQPDQPPLLRWAAVAGATNYSVEVDRGGVVDWVDTETYTTQTTSLVVPDPQENGQYWWRVRAEIGAGQSTDPSPARSYTVGPLPTAAGTTPINATTAEELVLEWDPVPGAVTYEIRVSADDSFDASQIIDQRVVKGTRYSPTKTYDVDDYWWQVRARNIFGKAKEWADVELKHQFRRTWEGTGVKPQLLYPKNAINPTVGDDFFYQWASSRLATRYRLDVGTDENFSPGTFNSCFTTQTTYTPGVTTYGKADPCMPGAMTTYYWRVKALDALSTEKQTGCEPDRYRSCEIQGVYSDIHTFVYSPGAVEPISPLTGQTVDIPTLRWKPALDADKYEVTIKWSDNGFARSNSVTTYSTSWTATGSSSVKLDPSKGPFTWTVRAIDHNGLKSPLPVFGAGETFDLSGDIPTTGATPLTPLTPDRKIPQPGYEPAPTARFPELAWEPVPGAEYYKLAIGTAGSGGVYLLPEKFPYPAATDVSDDFLARGSYDWVVQAFDKSGSELYNPGGGTFSIADLGTTQGHQVALDGLTVTTGVTCERSLLTDPTHVCTNQKATPVLDWQPLDGAGYYMVYLSRDRNFQNMVYGSYSDSNTIPVTTNTMWTPTEALPDSQAGVAYYWYIRPCKATGKCAPDPLRANHAFDKRSNSVELLAPIVNQSTGVVPQITTNAVTFDWADYLATNKKSTLANPFTAESAGQAARSYHLQVSTSSSFSTLVDEQYVDQTTYTAFDKMYPEGPLYWRVQATDGSGNALQWSKTEQFRKASPRPTPAGPTGTVSATEPFRWSPAPFAASYDLEVYKNGDTAASYTNRVISVSSLQVAYSPTKPLPAGTTYVWRVRRVDSSKNKGVWSGWSSFQVGGSTPAAVSPAPGAWVRTNDALFTWSATPGAVSYLFERREAGATYTSERVQTAATAWAPTRNLPTGKHEWRVTSLDAAGKAIRSSAWRSFTVDATAPAVKRIAPSGYSVKPRASLKIYFTEPVKNVSGKTIRLFKDGARRKLRARVTLSADRRVATLNPARNLRRQTYYTLKISSAVMDRQGNHLSAYSTRLRTR